MDYDNAQCKLAIPIKLTNKPVNVCIFLPFFPFPRPFPLPFTEKYIVTPYFYRNIYSI